MLVVAEAILPVFSIILLGFFLKQKGFIDPPFVKTANQIVFYVAIPAMLFSSISQAPFKENFQLSAALCLLAAIMIQLLFSLAVARFLAIHSEQRGTFLQSSFHGNLGYMAYAVSYYALGQAAFPRTAILSSVLLIVQNFLAVWVLVAFGAGRQNGAQEQQGKLILKGVLTNPIILAVAFSMLYSALGLPMPSLIGRTLKILSGMALPTALLLIGVSLSFTTVRLRVKEILSIGLLKLICFPLIGLAVMKTAHVPDFFLLPGAILMASPPATVTFVMAAELGGDPDLAASSISILTLASALSYGFLLFLLM